MEIDAFKLFGLFWALGPCGLLIAFTVFATLVMIFLTFKGRKSLVVTAISEESLVMDGYTAFVWTVRLEDGSVVRFFNVPNLFLGKTMNRTLDIQDSFEEGVIYKIVVSGASAPSLGQYKNIRSIKRI